MSFEVGEKKEKQKRSLATNHPSIVIACRKVWQCFQQHN